MGIPKRIQIPCHHVLANQTSLKFKKGSPLKQFFNINLGIGIIKKTTFFHILDISPCVFTQILSGRACWMWNLILHPTSTHIAYFWWTSLPKKQEIPEKMWWWCSGVCRKYAVSVCVGCRIKFCIQRALPLRIWVKTQGYM